MTSKPASKRTFLRRTFRMGRSLFISASDPPASLHQPRHARVTVRSQKTRNRPEGGLTRARRCYPSGKRLMTTPLQDASDAGAAKPWAPLAAPAVAAGESERGCRLTIGDCPLDARLGPAAPAPRLPRIVLKHFSLGPVLSPRVDAATKTDPLKRSRWEYGITAAARAFEQPRSGYGAAQVSLGAGVGVVIGAAFSGLPLLAQL